MEFKNILKDLREEAGLTQKQLAIKCGLSPQCISALEKGINSPTFQTLTALNSFFGNQLNEYLIPAEERAEGLGNHPTQLSASEWEWLALRSEILRVKGIDYLNTLVTMINAVINENNKK